MDLYQFYNTYKNQTIGDGQCVAWVKLYEREVLGFNQFFGINYAYQYFTDYDSNVGLQQRYTKHTLSELPKPGDIIVWNSNVGGGAGHVAIAYSDISQNSFISFDQNWTPNISKLENHNYSNVLGFLRDRNVVPPEPPGPTPAEKSNSRKWGWHNLNKKIIIHL